MNYIIKATEYDYNTNIRFIEDLIKDFPFLNVEIAGRSVSGKGIFSLSLGKPENSVLLIGAISAGDALSGYLLMLFCEKLCRCIKYGKQMCSVDVHRAFSQLGVTLIPFLNPDGCEIIAKGSLTAEPFKESAEITTKRTANLLGTDLNRNFPADREKLRNEEEQKGINGPSPSGFGGMFNESESETRTITRLCRLKSFRQCMSLSTESDCLYNHISDDTSGQATLMGKILADSCCCRYKEGNNLLEGSLSYWFNNEFKKPAFTLKAGKSFSSLPASALYKIYDNIEEALLLFTLM